MTGSSGVRRSKTASGRPGRATAEELLARVAARDREGLAKLYECLAPGLLGLLVRILSDRRAAEEVLLEVFLRVWKGARTYARQGSSVAAGLAVMTRSSGVSRLRAMRKLPALAFHLNEYFQKPLPWLPRPEQIALLDKRRELLQKVLNQLPQAQRGELELAVFEGLTEVEISERLGQPLARVKSELRAAMRFLRHRLRALLGTWTATI